jgi:hypothetical protein
MSDTKYPSPPGPVEPVPIDLGDGKKRFLRYSISTVIRLKREMGRSMFGRNGLLTNVDEELLPKLILAGLLDEDLKADTSWSLDQLEALPAPVYPYVLNCFLAAFTSQTPEPAKNVPLPPATAVN